MFGTRTDKTLNIHIFFYISALFPSNKIPENALSPQRAIVRRKIVLYHNFFRSKVRPSASNMLMMVSKLFLLVSHSFSLRINFKQLEKN